MMILINYKKISNNLNFNFWYLIITITLFCDFVNYKIKILDILIFGGVAVPGLSPEGPGLEGKRESRRKRRD